MAAPHSYYTRAKDQQYRAAGVLPFTLTPGGQVLILLGRERGWGPRSHLLRWKDFGGHREAIDEDAEATAAREFSEETLGLFGGPEVATCSIAKSTLAMGAHLRSKGGVFRVEAPLRGGGNYCMFVARVAYIDPLLFNLATEENAVTGGVTGAEKCGFAWVEAGRLLAAIEAEEAGSALKAELGGRGKKCNAPGGDANTGGPFEETPPAAERRATDGEGQKMSEERANTKEGLATNEELAFRRSVVAVMVKGPKPVRSARGGRSQREREHKLLLHSSFVCTLRRAQAGGLMEFLVGACQGGGLNRQVRVADWEGGVAVIRGKRKESGGQDGQRKKRRLSSECLVYWILHAKKIGALEESFEVGSGGVEEQVAGCAEARSMRESNEGTSSRVELKSSGFSSGGKGPLGLKQGEKDPPESSKVYLGGVEGCEEREFLNSFSQEQRSTVAGAFHEAVRGGANEPTAVVASVLARAVAKATQLRMTNAATDSQQHSPVANVSPLKTARLVRAHDLDDVGSPVSVLDSVHTEEWPPTVLVHNPASVNSETATDFVHKPKDSVAAVGRISSVQKAGDTTLEERPGIRTWFRDVESKGTGRLDPSDRTVWEVKQSPTRSLETTDCLEEPSAYPWAEKARQYARENSARETRSVENSVGENSAKSGREMWAVCSPGAQAAAAAWAALEHRLRDKPLEMPLAYACSVIEWGSLGEAEKKRRKKRRRLAQGRK